ncbi:hypothetical protein Trydic_g18952 [Trypoxylus dichotomus]
MVVYLLEICKRYMVTMTDIFGRRCSSHCKYFNYWLVLIDLLMTWGTNRSNLALSGAIRIWDGPGTLHL